MNSLLVFPSFLGVCLEGSMNNCIAPIMVICYLLASDNTAALLCKHHENGSESTTKVCDFPEVFPSKCSLKYFLHALLLEILKI